MRIKENY